MATSDDLRYPGTVGAEPSWRDRLGHRYLDRVLDAMPHNRELCVAFMRVLNLVEPPHSLCYPSVVRQVLGGSR